MNQEYWKIEDNPTTNEKPGPVIKEKENYISDQENPNEEIEALKNSLSKKDVEEICVESENTNRSCLSRWFGPIREGSLRGGIITMVAGTMGAGCLTFPYYISQVGLIPGIIALLFASISLGYMLQLVLESGIKTKIYNFNKLAKLSTGPYWLMIYDANNMIILSGCIINYCQTANKMLIEFIAHIKKEAEQYDYLFYIGLCFFFHIPLSLLKDISKLQYSSTIATISIMIVILIVGVECPFYIHQNIQDGKEIKYFEKLNWGYLSIMATYMYGYCNHNLILQVINELKNPTLKRGKKVLYRSWIGEFIFYVIIGFGGYLSSLDNTKEVFISREDLKSYSPDYMILVSKLIISICLCCLIPMRFNIIRDSIKSVLKRDNLSFWFNFIITSTWIIFLNILAYFTNIPMIIEIMGGISTILTCCYIPLFDYSYAFKEKSGKKYIIGLVLLVIFTFFGVGASVQSLINFILAQIKKNEVNAIY